MDTIVDVVVIIFVVLGVLFSAGMALAYLGLIAAAPVVGGLQVARWRQIAKAAIAEGLYAPDGSRLRREGGVVVSGFGGWRSYPAVYEDDFYQYRHRIKMRRWPLQPWTDAWVARQREADGSWSAYLCDADGRKPSRGSRHPEAMQWWEDADELRLHGRVVAAAEGRCPHCGEDLEGVD